MKRIGVAVGLAAVLAAALAAQAPEKPAPQQPTFRTGVNFVRVDVYPTLAGRAVGDLTKDEFEILEDGLPQRVEAFERIVVRPPGESAERGDPASVNESNDAAADPRNRVFVLFLDTYHTPQDRRPDGMSLGRPPMPRERPAPAAMPPASSGRITHALARLLDQMIGPDDLLGVFTPEMRVDAITFTRQTAPIEAMLEQAPWQRSGAFRDRDAREEMYYGCYATQDPDPAVEHLIARRREMLVLGALRDLLVHLQNIREARTAILLVSQGWKLFTPVEEMAAAGVMAPGTGTQAGVPTAFGPPEFPHPPLGAPQKPPPVGVAPPVDAPRTPPVPPGPDQKDREVLRECDRDRRVLFGLDDVREFRDIEHAARRANVTFYPIDPRGLVPDTAFETQHELLRRLALATGGIAVVDSNDIERRARGIVDDVSTYYLLGYRSFNTKADGKFRAISVRVKRQGVTVRARPGYTAPTQAEIAEQTKIVPQPDAEADLRSRALSSLGADRPNVPVRVAAGYAFGGVAADGASPARVMWIVGELTSAALRSGDWYLGGDATIEVTNAEGQRMTAAEASLPPAMPRFMLQVLDTPLRPGDYVVKVRVRSRPAAGQSATAQVRVTVPDPGPAALEMLGRPLLFRRGPQTARRYDPTAEPRFHRTEWGRLDVPIAGVAESVAAQLLDRRGQALSVPVTIAQREEAGGRRFLTAEIDFAPLAPADYLFELSVRRGDKMETILTALRVIP